MKKKVSAAADTFFFFLYRGYGPSRVALVGAGKEYAASRGFASNHAGSRCSVSLEGDASDGGFSLLLDALLSFGCAVPVGEHEAALLDLFFELLVSVYLYSVFLAIVECLLVDALLDFIEQMCYVFLDTVA